MKTTFLSLFALALLSSAAAQTVDYAAYGTKLAKQAPDPQITRILTEVSQEKIRTTLDSIYRYNFKRSLAQHDNVERTYALNEEAAVVVCDYGKAERPRIPFPYFAEAWTGLEYTAAALMIRNRTSPFFSTSRRRVSTNARMRWLSSE